MIIHLERESKKERRQAFHTASDAWAHEIDITFSGVSTSVTPTSVMLEQDNGGVDGGGGGVAGGVSRDSGFGD